MHNVMKIMHANTLKRQFCDHVMYSLDFYKSSKCNYEKPFAVPCGIFGTEYAD